MASQRATRAATTSKATTEEKSDKGSGRPTSAELNSSPGSDIAGLIRAAVSEALTDDSFLCGLIDKLVERISARLLDDVTARVTASFADQLEASNRRIDELSKELSSLKETSSAREKQTDGRLDGLAQYQRRNNLRLFGVPEAAGEDVTKVVTSLLSDKLEVSVTADMIDRCHRVGRRPLASGSAADSRPRAILVKYVSYQTKLRVLSARGRLKGTGVSVREDLTQKRAVLHKQMVEKYGLRNVWTRDGRIFWRDADTVFSSH
jgi:hypothetical protein